MHTFILLFSVIAAHAATPTFNSLSTAAASPNSATVSVTVIGGVSMQIQHSTDTSFGIKTPWFPVASSAVIGQMQQGATYNVRVVACDQAVTAFGSCSGAQGTSGTVVVSTTGPRVSYTVSITQGVVNGYNTTQFPLNGRWMDGDTNYCDKSLSGVIRCFACDGGGPQNALASFPYNGGRNVYLTTVNSTFDTYTLLNALGTGNGADGVGPKDSNDIPACWAGDGTNIKSHTLYHDGNTLYMGFQRHQDGGWEQNVWVNRSDDGGVTWYRPDHNAGQASATGDPACPGAGIMWTNAWHIKYVKLGTPGNVPSEAIDGADAYHYAQLLVGGKVAIGSVTYTLARCYRKLNLQNAANYEYWTSTIGADPNVSTNWTTSIGGATAHYDPSVYGTGDEEVQYIPTLHRWFITTYHSVSSTDWRTVVIDAPHITGPWTLRYQEASQPIPNVYRAWMSFFFPNLVVTQTSPPIVTVGMLHGGQYTQQTQVDPVNDFYSPWLLPLTITGSPTGLFPTPAPKIH